MINPGEAFIVGIVLVGFGVMLRIIKLQGALMIIGLIAVAALILPYTGKYSEGIPSWMFWWIVIIIGINVLRAILGMLFGRPAADSFTGRLLYQIFSPVFRMLEAFFRGIFRVK